MKKELFWYVGVVSGIVAVALSIVVGAYFFRASSGSSERVVSPSKIQVVATFYPLAVLANGVAGDAADVSSVVPGGVEPHDYEPTSRDIIGIREADIFLFNGAGMDAWAEKLRPELESSGIRVVGMAEYVDLISREDEEVHEYGEEAEETEEEHVHGIHDPHFWLDPVVAMRFVTEVRDALSEVDPGHIGTYRKNAQETLGRLSALDTAYREGLSSCGKHEVIVSHDAFSYLAKRYGFSVHAIAGLSPEAEPSVRRVAELTELAKKENIRYIFFETLVSPKVSETLAKEIGAETLVFDPIEGLTPENERVGADYFSIMRENLRSLAVAMECE